MSEIKYSYIKSQTDILRLDSFYYSKEFLTDENLIAKHKNKSLKELNATLLSFGAYSLNNFVEYKESGVPFIRGVNMKDGLLDFSDMIYIDEKAHKLLWKSEVKPNTVLLSMSGTIGDVAFAFPEYSYPMNSNQDIAKITLNNPAITPYYLYVFLRSKYGQNFLIREARGSVQQHVFLSQMENIRLPLFSVDFQSQIEQIVKSAHAKLEESKSLYAEAEEILLSELGLKDWQPKKNSHTDSILLTQNQDEDTKTKRDSVGISNPCDTSNPCGNIANYSIKRFSDFASSGRLDAEYYQPKYDSLFEHLAKYKCTKLGDIVTIRKSVEPGSESYIEKGIPFIRVSDVNKFEIAETDLHLSPKDFNLELLKPHKNTILFSKDGSIGIAYKCEEDLNVITSGALLHLDICNKEVLPDYLTLVLNSVVVHLQAERDSNGAIIQHWKPDDIKKVLIPLLPESIQALIAEKIQKSFDLRKQSKQLLEQAKRMVEEEIEKQ